MKIAVVLALLLLVSPVLADTFPDLRGNTTISPHLVDTSVVNQTFVYTIIPLNESLINRTAIYAPENYTIIAVQDITLNGTTCLATACTQREVNSSQIAFNLSAAVNSTVNSPIIVTFLANTSSFATSGNFTSFLNNSAYHNQTAAINTNVSTQQMLNISTSIVKGTAIINGTDFWEFKFTLGFNTAAAGLIQFKMNSWVDAAGKTLNITLSNGTTYATLRNNSGNFSDTNGKFNVNTTYGTTTTGINRSNVVDNFLYLRMYIPLGSSLSDSWSTTYGFLFRSTP